jgi:PTH1 family peptidyl-tRNA hydrolase
MKLIIGLGNPGKKYMFSRHNVGFRALGLFRRRNDFPPFKDAKKLLSAVSMGSFGGEKIILIKPQTFMNGSGKAAQKVLNFYRIKTTHLAVVHDDADLELGSLKIVSNRGSAGHKGVQSIIDALNTKDFVRFRLGVRPLEGIKAGSDLKKLVLNRFTKEEKNAIRKQISLCEQALEFFLKEDDLEKTMTRFN